VTFYRFARAVVLSVCKVVFRVRVVGREHVPPDGAYIVAPTHRSGFDVPFAAFVTTRTIRFLAKEELFANRFWTWLFSTLGAIPVERGTADRGAMRVLEAALRDGEPVAVFPEGTRRSGAELGPLFGGAGYLAVKLGVPVIPVGIGGSERILPPGARVPRLGRVAIVIGEPIHPPAVDGRSRRAAATKVTEQLSAELGAAFARADALARTR
jgi:1-acyl-sn-glycerol-3-phosphate acyltransferase